MLERHERLLAWRASLRGAVLGWAAGAAHGAAPPRATWQTVVKAPARTVEFPISDNALNFSPKRGV